MASPVYTIGQGSRTFDALLEALKSRRIAFLCDVRSVPISNYAPEFCAFELKTALAAAGVTYVALGEKLGGRPKDESLYTDDGRVDYELLVPSLPFQSGLDRVARGAEAGHSLALFCSEGEPERCHRSKAIGRALAERGLDVVHIDRNDQEVSQPTVMLRLDPPLTLLDGMPDARTTSRGRYL